MSMPRFLNTRASSLLTSSSSLGTTRGRNSMMLISEPKLRKIEPNSTPTAPAPMIASDFGICLSERISMFVRIVSSAVSPGSSFASDPVARITFFA